MIERTRPVAAARSTTDAALYDRVARDSAARVIHHYSSSFGLASRLLAQPVRDHVRTIYALVRLADEVVDGAVGVDNTDLAGAVLERLEQDTRDALRDGFSANLVVHAFSRTAATCGIGIELVTPFFDSMRADLTVREHDRASFDRYVHGSAEVVGLMCLQAFVNTDPGVDPHRPPVAVHPDSHLAEGARRLGAAFQKVNFLRDLGEDEQLRGRRYFPGIDPALLTEAQKHALLDDIDADLAAAAAVIRDLPPSSRRAVAVAHGVFAGLSARLRSTPAREIVGRRVRVAGPRKARIAVSVVLRERWA